MLALLVFIGLLAQVNAPREADAKWHEEVLFDRYWSQYLLQKAGCVPPPGDVVAQPIKKEECTIPPTMNAEAYARARELAKKVFDLTEPKR